MSRLPQDIAIDITRALRALGVNVSRYDVVAKVLVLESTENSAEMQGVAETPVITGPLFVDQRARRWIRRTGTPTTRASWRRCSGSCASSATTRPSAMWTATR